MQKNGSILSIFDISSLSLNIRTYRRKSFNSVVLIMTMRVYIQADELPIQAKAVQYTVLRFCNVLGQCNMRWWFLQKHTLMCTCVTLTQKLILGYSCMFAFVHCANGCVVLLVEVSICIHAGMRNCPFDDVYTDFTLVLVCVNMHTCGKHAIRRKCRLGCHTV